MLCNTPDTLAEGSPTPAGQPSQRNAGCCAECAGHEGKPQAGSGRRRLWALNPRAHCPIVGVCLPMAALRRLACKVLGGEVQAADYELHCFVGNDCRQRTRMAEAVQRELDRRFLLPLRHAAAAKSTAALADWWQQQAAAKDLPGALWATLTHPRCTPELELQVLGQVHMLQHQVGMATRVELARFEALIDENAVLARALANAQRRSTGQASEQARQNDALQAELLRLRGQHLAAASQLATVRDELQSLRSAVPDLQSRTALATRCAQQAERIVDLQRALQQARSDTEQAAPSASNSATSAGSSHSAASVNAIVALSTAEAAADALANRAVLCVGGRTAGVPAYRRLVESCGGRFLHHDGGQEHNARQLESTLAAADLVICQTGCVSHNAYWRVKDHCKRTGKRCVFVETPSAAALQRALVEIGSTP